MAPRWLASVWTAYLLGRVYAVNRGGSGLFHTFAISPFTLHLPLSILPSPSSFTLAAFHRTLPLLARPRRPRARRRAPSYDSVDFQHSNTLFLVYVAVRSVAGSITLVVHLLSFPL